MHNADSWGQLPFALIADIEAAFQQSGFFEAVDAAGVIAEEIGQGKVPAIDDLVGVIEGDVQRVVDEAVVQATRATQLLNSLDIAVLEDLFNTLQATITGEEQFAFSIPGGRVVFRRSFLDVSLCVVVAGPGGTRVTIGISNGAQLCGNPAKRFANPGLEPVAFADFAVGYTNLQVRRKLWPTPLPISTEATTYFQLHDDWVQLRLAGMDPASLKVKLSVVIGVRLGFSFKPNAEVEGQCLVEVEVKPNEVAATLGGITTILTNRLGSVSPSMAAAAPELVADVLLDVFAYLQGLEEDGKELGEASISLATDAGLGVGIWDTTFNVVSIGAQFKLGVPLEALYGMQADALAALLEAGMAVSAQMGSVMESMAEGRLSGAELQSQLSTFGSVAEDLGKSIVDAYVGYLDSIFIEYETGIYGLGDIGQAAAQTIPVLVAKVKLPIGQMLVDGIASIPEFVEGVLATVQAAAWLAQFAMSTGLEAAESVSLSGIIGSPFGFIDPPTNVPSYIQRPRGSPPVPPTIAEWEDLASRLVDDVTLSMRFGAIGMEGLSLGNLVRLIADSLEVSQTLIAGAIRSAVHFSEKPLWDAIVVATAQVGQNSKDLLIFNLQNLGIFYENSLGASGTVGAEGQVGLGGRIAFDARLKASLALLAFSNENYDEEDETLLAGVNIPIEMSASAGVSLGEGVEFTAEGGFTVGKSLAKLTLKDWGQDLPVPAGLTIAGFEVIEFVGESR